MITAGRSLILLAGVFAFGCTAAKQELRPRPLAEARFSEPVTTQVPPLSTGPALKTAADLPYKAYVEHIADPVVARQFELLLVGLRDAPSAIDIRIDLGRFLLEHGHADLAVGPLRDAFLLRPGQSAVATLLAEAYLKSSRLEEATKLAERLVTERPQDSERWIFKAEVYRRADKPREAIAAANRALLLEPGRHEPRLIVAFAAAELRLDGLVRKLIGELREEPASDKVALDYLEARLLLGEESWQQALRLLNRVLAADAKHSRALNDRGFVYAKLSRFDDAVADFQRAIEIDQALAEAHLNLANILVDRDEILLAQEALDAASHELSAHAAFLLAAGRRYALEASSATGRQLALEHLRRAQQVVPVQEQAAIQRAIERIEALPPPAQAEPPAKPEAQRESGQASEAKAVAEEQRLEPLPSLLAPRGQGAGHDEIDRYRPSID
jgi:tetratricopeptide (TPR) repeat protein